jgi:hypothetical protein
MTASFGDDDAHRPHPRISEVLRGLMAGFDEETVSLGAILDRLGMRGFGFLILLASLPMVIPNLPGVSTIFGLLIVAPAIQILVGGTRVWLPARLRHRAVSSKTLIAIMTKTLPIVEKAERLVRPRWIVLTLPPVRNVIGALMVALGLIMALPVPGGNMPPGIACALISIGLLERDGVFVALGMLIGLVALAFAASIIYGVLYLGAAVAG